MRAPSSARSGVHGRTRSSACNDESAPGQGRICDTLKPSPSSPSRLARGMRTLIEGEFADRGDVISQPIQRSGRTRRTPGASIGTITQEWRRVRSASASVTPSTIRKLQRGCAAPVMNHLRAADDVVVAVARDRGCDVGGVGRGHVGFGHPEGRARLGFQQRPQPARLLLRRGAVLQRDHVGNVGRLAVEDLGRPEQPSHDFGERRVFEVRKPRPWLVGGELGQAQDSTIPAPAPSAATRT